MYTRVHTTSSIVRTPPAAWSWFDIEDRDESCSCYAGAMEEQDTRCAQPVFSASLARALLTDFALSSKSFQGSSRWLRRLKMF